MPASDHMGEQFAPLYHGTGAELKPGDIVEPRAHLDPEHAHYRDVPTVFASKYREMAQSYAQHVTQGQGQQAMFGHVYEVEPVDPAEVRHRDYESLSNKGFRVKRHVSAHPIVNEG